MIDVSLTHIFPGISLNRFTHVDERNAMRDRWFLCFLLAGCHPLPFVPAPQASIAPSATVPSAKPTLQYKRYTLPSGIAHTLLIPSGSAFRVVPAVSPSVETLANFAQKYGAIAVINGGFFDPENQQSTSYALVQNQWVADPQQNDRLMQNPNLAPYLNQILNRTELRRYVCGSTTRYDITQHRAPIPSSCRLVDALGAGPQLRPTLTLESEGFLTIVQGAILRDPLGANQANARSAIGLTRDGSILWVMVAQTADNPVTGISLPALANWMKTQGVEKAMNLDGGSSASLFYQGKTYYGKVDQAGNTVQRPVKSVWLVLPEASVVQSD